MIEIAVSATSAFVGFGLGFFLFNVMLPLSITASFALPILGCLSVVGLARIYLKRYFAKQIAQFKHIVTAVEKRLRPSAAQPELIDDTYFEQDATSGSQPRQHDRS